MRIVPSRFTNALIIIDEVTIRQLCYVAIVDGPEAFKKTDAGLGRLVLSSMEALHAPVQQHLGPIMLRLLQENS